MNTATLSRIWHSLRLCAILSSGDRADYLRTHKIFHHIGTGCTIMSRKVPLCAKLISIGNNVHLASKVSLTCHDAIHLALNNLSIQPVGGGLRAPVTRRKLAALR